jgi:hypothetical protein
MRLSLYLCRNLFNVYGNKLIPYILVNLIALEGEYMVDRADCVHFEYKYLEEKGKRVKIPTCKIGKMKGIEGCQEYCEWFEPLDPRIPRPPMPPGPPEHPDPLRPP